MNGYDLANFRFDRAMTAYGRCQHGILDVERQARNVYAHVQVSDPVIAIDHRMHARAGLGLVSCLVLACAADLPEIRYETDEVEVGTEFDAPLCGADLEHLDTHVRRVEAALATESDQRVRIYLYSGFPPCETHGAYGCFVDGDYISTNWSAVDHEIVHAVVARFADPSDFWDEGTAEALSGIHTEPGETSPADDFDRHDAAIDYLTAGHFVRWLTEDIADTIALRDFLDGATFPQSFGITLEDAVDMYDGAPWSYPPIEHCDAPALSPTSEGTWQEIIRMSCEDTDATLFGGNGISKHRSFEVTQRATFRLEVSAGEGARLIGCQTDVLEDRPADFDDGDLYNQSGGDRVGAKLFRAGMVHEIELVPGRYDMNVTANEGDQVAVSLARVTE